MLIGALCLPLMLIVPHSIMLDMFSLSLIFSGAGGYFATDLRPKKPSRVKAAAKWLVAKAKSIHLPSPAPGWQPNPGAA